jgi:hypothetical protein
VDLSQAQKAHVMVLEHIEFKKPIAGKLLSVQTVNAKGAMNPIRQRFWNFDTTSGAHLSCIPGIDQHHRRTSFFRFVLSGRYQHPPGSVRYAFCQTVVLKHVFDVQVFKRYDIILICRSPRTIYWIGDLSCPFRSDRRPTIPLSSISPLPV